MIISGGENLYPQGIEDVLLAHQGVHQAAIVGVPDDDLGQRVRAFGVADDAVTEAALRRHAKAHLAVYEVPRDFVFVDDLPRNATGKILRRELAER